MLIHIPEPTGQSQAVTTTSSGFLRDFKRLFSNKLPIRLLRGIKGIYFLRYLFVFSRINPIITLNTTRMKRSERNNKWCQYLLWQVSHYSEDHLSGRPFRHPISTKFFSFQTALNLLDVASTTMKLYTSFSIRIVTVFSSIVH